jgi:hypothetical protein
MVHLARKWGSIMGALVNVAYDVCDYSRAPDTSRALGRRCGAGKDKGGELGAWAFSYLVRRGICADCRCFDDLGDLALGCLVGKHSLVVSTPA